MVFNSFWSCEYVYSSFALAFLYLVVSVIVLRFILVLTEQVRLCSPHRKPQKLFLLFLLCQMLCRFAYFTIAPLYFRSCDRNNNSFNIYIASFFGVVPANLFLTAFTILVYTFGRIYHTVINSAYYAHKVMFYLLIVFLISCVLAMIAVSIVMVDQELTQVQLIGQNINLVVESVAAIMIGALFSYYALTLHLHLSSPANATSLGSSPGKIRSGSHSEKREPMKQLTYCAFLTFLCFLFRGGYLLHQMIVGNLSGLAEASSSLFMIYFITCELVPSVLMMYSFSTLAGNGSGGVYAGVSASTGLATAPLIQSPNLNGYSALHDQQRGRSPVLKAKPQGSL